MALPSPLFRRFLLCAATLIALPQISKAAADPLMNIPPGNYAQQIGTNSLHDPSGANHSSLEVRGSVVVAIFTVPSWSQGGRQKKWAALLADEPATRIDKPTRLVLIEDMAQTGLAELARNQMKEKFSPGSRPLLLLDETGAITKHFGIPRDRTQVLVYDKQSRLRHVETENPSPETAARVKKIVAILQAE